MLPLLQLSVMGMSKPFHKPSVKKPPHVKKFSTQRYSSLCRDSKCPTIWMLVHCGAGTSLGPQLGTSRLSGRPAFGLTPSEPRGPSLRPLGSSCPSVNSIHSWVFSITALGAVVLSKELLSNVKYLYVFSMIISTKNNEVKIAVCNIRNAEIGGGLPIYRQQWLFTYIKLLPA